MRTVERKEAWPGRPARLEAAGARGSPVATAHARGHARRPPHCMHGSRAEKMGCFATSKSGISLNFFSFPPNKCVTLQTV